MYKVIRDQQEKVGFWDFARGKWCEGTEERHMKTADYTLEGYEDKILIERKKNIAEFARNINESRFVRELERMENVEFPYVVLEFDMIDLMTFPASADLPPSVKRKIRVRGPFILKRLTEFQMKYKTKFIFAGPYGKEVAGSLFIRFIESLENGNESS